MDMDEEISPRHWSVHDGKFFASAIADAQRAPNSAAQEG